MAVEGWDWGGTTSGNNQIHVRRYLLPTSMTQDPRLKTEDRAKPAVLIADDQPDVLEALRLLLRGEGFDVESVTSPGGVLRGLERREFGAFHSIRITVDFPLPFGPRKPKIAALGT